MAATIAALAMLGALGNAHATFPGENGVIVFENPVTKMIGRTPPSGGAITYLAPGNSPAVSPSGKKIAYALNGRIRVMNIDGTNDVQLTGGPADGYPAWTTSGNSIAFIRNGFQLWVMNQDGSSQGYSRLLGANLTYTASGLDWSPSASSPLQITYAVGPNMGSTTGVFIADAGQDQDLAELGHGLYPSYAPDGASVIYRGQDGNAREVNTNATNDHLVSAAGLASRNAISPDGTLIAAGVGDGTTNRLQTRPRAGGSATVQWSEQAWNPSWSRVPQNCYETTPQGGGGMLAGNTDFYAEQCAVVVMPDGGQMSGGVLMQAVAIGPDKRVYLSTLKNNSVGVPTWTPFVPTIGVSGNTGGVVAKEVAIAGAKDGSSQLVITVDDGTVYHTVRNANGTWQASGFQPLVNGSLAFQARDVAITINASSASSPGNAQVIANGIDVGGVYHRVRSADGSWTEWAGVPGATGLNTRQLAIAAGEDGNTNVLTTVVQPDGATAQIKRQVRYANGTWDPSFVTVAVPSSVTLPALTTRIALTLTAGSAGKAQLMYTDAAGRAWFQERSSPLNQFAWTGPVGNTQVASGGSRAVSISAQPGGTGASEVMLTRTSPQ